MKLNYIAFAVPLFMLFIAIEYWVSVKRKRPVHHLNESVANINVGIAERLCDLLTTGAFFFVFSWINKNFALFQIKPTIYTWVALFLLTDLVWYWYHRFGHEVNLFWSVHVVHHQSDDFNYTVSARITILQAVVRGLFWAVLPFIGFPAMMIVSVLLIHGAYPFFTHTQLIGKLGWLEKVFVTPSHHRVHHSSNPEYLDKNYGDVLIIWDKLFDTFAEETVEPKYGLTKPLNSHSFLWQHFHFILEMIVAFKLANGYKQKLKVLFGSPSSINPRIRPYLERKLSSKREHIKLTKKLDTLLKVQTVATIIILFCTILFQHYLSAYQLAFAALFILISVINTGAIIEQQSWVFHLDFLRLVLLLVIIHSFYLDYIVSVISLATLTLIILFYRTIQTQYNNLMYELN